MNIFMMKMWRAITLSIRTAFHNRRGFLAVLLSLLCLFCAGCNKNAEIDKTRALIEYNVPFIDTYSRWIEIDLIDTDEEGRQIYGISATGDSFNNVFSDYVIDDEANSPVYAFLICQMVAEDEIYCYDGVCYAFAPNFLLSYDLLESLKAENDWNEELDESKMTAYPIKFDKEIKRSKYSVDFKENAVSALEKELGRDFNGYYIDDLYTEENELVMVIREVQVWITKNTQSPDTTDTTSVSESTNIFGSAYVFTYDETTGDVKYQELDEDIESWRHQINMFKEGM